LSKCLLVLYQLGFMPQSIPSEVKPLSGRYNAAMEPGNPIVLHFVSGASLFSGAVILLGAILLAGRMATGWRRSIRDVAAVLGGAFIFLSATPGPRGLAVVLAGGVAAWIVCGRLRGKWAGRTALVLRVILAALMLLAVGLEIPWRFMPSLPEGQHGRIVVLGDSISQGIVRDRSWPQAFAARHGVPALNLALNGATAVSARVQQAPHIPPEADLVILEIGGNDMLGGTPAAQFANDLDKLLANVVRPGRTVVMLELPLPPTFEDFGRAQRAAAAKHGVALVPKSYFCQVLAVPDGTVDGLHLAQRGMDAVADMVYGLLADHLHAPAKQAAGN
jgi:acyl-CoA thioesterase I